MMNFPEKKKKKKMQKNVNTQAVRSSGHDPAAPCLSLPHPLLALGDEKTVLHCALVCEQSPGLTRVKDQLLSVREKQKHGVRKKAEPDGGQLTMPELTCQTCGSAPRCTADLNRRNETKPFKV